VARIVAVKVRKQVQPVEVELGEVQVEPGDKVVVETRGGSVLGTVMPREAHACLPAIAPRVPARFLRVAEEADLRQEELNIRMERDYFKICQQKIKKHQLPMKLVDVEIDPDGSKVIFFFVAENRVDFRALVKELASDLRTRIEMRQIGARSEAQRLGGLGCCGRELCCMGFLRNFCPVTVKMTKEQGLPLDPEKISGVCGRLMCCLAYEYDSYVELKQGLPKVGKRIVTPQGPGRVRQINIMKKKLVVELEDGVLVEMKTDDFTADMLVK